ncbi:MAG: hypothetical protein IKK43_01670, partial [Clostridia bacterium]|nr:hypothetical protein [Clostridia bacterium]
ITYTYYTDSSCSTQTPTTTGASVVGGAPKNAGTYYVKATIKESGNYAVATSNAATLTINKANATITPSTTNVTITTNNTTTVTYTYNGDGQVTIENSDSTKAEATLDTNAKTITIKGVAEGTTTITLKAAAGTNYNAAEDKTITVTIAKGNYSVDGVYYPTLATAYAAIDGTEGTIVVEADNTDDSVVTIANTKNITIDTRDKTITRTKTISNNGTLTITGTGTITMTEGIDLIVNSGDLIISSTGTLSNTSGLNVNVIETSKYLEINTNTNISIEGNNDVISGTAGKINISDGNIRGTINSKGELNITGGTFTSQNVVINNSGTGTANISNATISTEGYYAMVMHSDGTININEGTIINGGSISAIYINSAGTLKVGNDDNNVSRTSPEITGGSAIYIGKSVATVEFYDGVLKGESKAFRLINGVTAEDVIIPGEYEICYGTASVEGTTYETAYLKKISSISAINATVTYGNTVDVAYTYNGDGKVTATPGSANVATVQAVNETTKKITIKGVKVGTEIITVNAAEGEEFTPNKTMFTVTVIAKSLADVTANITTTTHTYNGTAKTQTIKLTDGDYTLVEGTDYTVAYVDNVYPGTATVTVTGKGNYTGTITKTFTINKATPTLTTTLAKANITENNTITVAYTYDGDGTVTIENSDSTKVEATLDTKAKTITIKGVAEGTATITLKAAAGANYNAAEDKTITVTVAKGNYSVNGVHYSTLAAAYTAIPENGGTIIVEAETVTDSSTFIVEGKSVILDTNGNKIIKTGSGILNKGTLSIIGNGTITNSEGFNSIDNQGTLEITDATIENTSTTHKPIINRAAGTITLNSGMVSGKGWGIDSYGTVIMKGGTVKAETSADSWVRALYTEAGATTTVSGGNIIAINNYTTKGSNGIGGAGKKIINGNANISAKGYSAYAIETFASAETTTEVKISGNPTITAESVVSGGNARALSIVGSGVIIDAPVEITGGTLTATAVTDANAYGVFVSGNSATTTITGGTMTGEGAGVRMGSNAGKLTIGTSEGEVNTITPVISGGSKGVIAPDKFNFYGGVIKGTNKVPYNEEEVEIRDGKYYIKTTGPVNNIYSSVLVLDEEAPSKPTLIAETQDGKVYNEGDWANQYVYITPTSTDSSSGVDYYEWLENGKTTWEKVVGVKADFFADRNEIQYFRAVDKMGNISEVAEFRVKIDKVVPTISVTDIKSLEDAKLTISDAISGIKYFAVTTSDVAPTNAGTTNVTSGSELNYWYQVQNTTNETTVTFKNVNAGKYYAWVKDAAGNVANVEFNVSTQSIQIPSSPAEKTYNGKAQEHGITIPAKTSIVTTGSTLEATNVGTYSVIVKLDDAANYTWNDGTTENKTVTWVIKPISMADVNVEAVPEQLYAGNAITPKPKVTITVEGNTLTLVEGTDFTYGYSNNTGVGTATITITGRENYSGSKTVNFEICVAGIKIPSSPAIKVYNGKSQSHGITIPEYTSIVTEESTLSATNAGRYNVVLKLDDPDNYNWNDETTTNKEIEWVIEPFSLTNASVAAVTDQAYTGSAITPKPVVTAVVGGNTVTLVEGTDFIYEYSDNTDAGTATITVTGQGNYAESKKVNFTILTEKIEIPNSPADKTYNGSSQSHGIIIPANVSIVAINSTTAATNAGTYSVELKLNSTNFVWSDGTTEDKTITWTIKPYDVANINIAAISDQLYTGSAITPKPVVTVKLGENTTTLVEGTDFTYGYSNNLNAGTANVTVTGEGNYAGSKTISFKILTLTVQIPNSPADKVYNKNAQEHGITIPANTSIVTAKSTTSATDAGTYKVVLELDDSTNYKWSDGTTTNKEITWKIAKASSTITLNNSILELHKGKTGTITFSYNGDSTVDVVSNDSTIANAAIDGNAITVTALKYGTTTITVSAEEGKNYSAPQTQTITVNVISGNYSVNGVHYATLSDAIKAIDTEGTIIVERDNEDSSNASISNNKKITLDMNNKTITKTTNAIYVGVGSTLNIKDEGTIIGGTNHNVVLNEGTLNLEDATIRSEDPTQTYYAVRNKGTLNVTSGVISAKGTAIYNTSITNINGGEIIGTGDLEGNFDKKYVRAIYNVDGELYIRGGKILAENPGSSYGVRTVGGNGGKIEITGGEIIANAPVSATAVENYVTSSGESGNIKISGNPTITANATGTSGQAIAVQVNCKDGYTQQTNIVIEGGTLTATTNGNTAYGVDTEKNTGDIVITGGTITSNDRAINVAADHTGKVIIGTNDGTIPNNSPVIKGEKDGIASGGNVEFYDGIFKGKINAMNVTGKVTTPEGYDVVNDKDGDYKVAYLSNVFGTGNALITEWTIPANKDSDGNGTTIKLPITSHVNNNYVVDWGDGTIERYTTEKFPTHEYKNTTETKYTIKIVGDVNRFGCLEGTAPLADNDYYTFTQYLTGLKAWGELGTTSYGFANCINLAGSVPAPTENTFVNVNEFNSLFLNCKKITSLPENLFADASQAVNFNNTFNGCSGITTLPETLFNGAIDAKGFYGTFQGCTGLKEIPAELFIDNQQAETMALAFQGCTGLKEIPGNLFANNTKVTSFESTFNACTGIESIPENLFKNNTKVKQFNATFYGCSGLTGDIPRELFANTKEVTTFNGMFNGCVKLTGGELLIDTSNNPDLGNMFWYCPSIKTLILGEDFKIINGSGMFNGDNNLRALILSNNPASISEAGTLGALNTINLPESTIIYVPTSEAETIYEDAWNGIIETTRIEPILKLVGSNRVQLEGSLEYNEQGYTVAGYGMTDEGEYTKYGYKVTISDGLPIDDLGSFVRTYTLSKNIDGTLVKIDSEERTIYAGITVSASISTNNVSHVYAKAGDTITLVLKSNQELGKVPTVNILGKVATVSPSNTGVKEYTATIKVEESDEQGEVKVLITDYEDKYGNKGKDITSTTDNSSVYVDTMGTSKDKPEKISVTENTIKVQAKQEDNLSNVFNSGILYVEYAIKKSSTADWLEYQESNVFTGLSIGEAYDIKTRTTDAAGNVSESDVLTNVITKNITSDDITFSTNTNEWTNQNVEVTIHWPETTLEKYYRINGEEWKSTTESNTLVIATQYEDVITAKLVNGAINEITNSIMISNIDKVKPTVTATVDNRWTNTDKEIIVSAQDNTDGSGIAGYYITIDPSYVPQKDVFIKDTNTTHVYVKPMDTYYIWVVDAAGNVSEAGFEVKVTNIETQKPVITYVDTNMVAANKEDKIEIMFNAEDNNENLTTTLKETDIKVFVGGEEVTPTNIKLSYEATGNVIEYVVTISGIVGDGELTIEIPANKVTDIAGNKNDVTTLRTDVTIDNKVPEKPIVAVEPDGEVVNEDVLITITPRPEEKYEYSTDGGKTWEDVADNRIIISEEGETDVLIRAEDLAGNKSETEEVNIIIDRKDPVLSDPEIILPKDENGDTKEQVKDGDKVIIKVPVGDDNEVVVDKDKIKVTVDGESLDVENAIVATNPDTNKQEIIITIPVDTDKEGEIIVELEKGTVTDMAGNPSDEKHIETGIIVDNTKPEVSITNPGGEHKSGDKITYTIEIGEENPYEINKDKIVVEGGRIDKVDTSTPGKIIVDVVVGDGNGKVTITTQEGLVTDAAGNKNTMTSDNSVVVDNIPPVLDGVSINNGATTTTEVGVTVQINATNANWMYVTNDEKTLSQVMGLPEGSNGWLPYANETLHELTQGDGNKTVYVWVKDNAGNITGPKKATITLNATIIGNKEDKVIVDGKETVTNTQSNSTTIKFKVTDQYFYSSTILENNIVAFVDNNECTTAIFNRVTGNTITNGAEYEAIVANVSGDGKLSIGLKNASVKDKAGNVLGTTTTPVLTDIVIDNTAPTLTVTTSSIAVSDTNLVGVMLNGKLIRTTNGTTNITVPAGSIVKAIDKAGNTTTVTK